MMRFLQPVHIGADTGEAGFNTPVSFADLSILGQRRGRVVPKQRHIIPQIALVALQGRGRNCRLAQSPVSSLRKEGLQEFPLGVAEKFHVGSAPVWPPQSMG